MVSHRKESRESAPSRAKRLAEKGDVFFQTVRPYQKNNYLFDLPYHNYVFSTGYAQLRPKGDSYFLLNRLQEEHFVSKVLDRCTGTSYPAINSSDLAQIKVGVPKEIEEQNQIGNFLKYIDITITLHQRKLQQLKLLKKACLQQMFPTKNTFIPNLRFNKFENQWTERKLSEIFTERNERSSEGELISVTINAGVLKASKLNKIDNSSNDKSNYKVVKKGDIPYNSMRMWQGASGFSPYDGILSPAYTVLVPRKNVDSLFFSYMFKKYEMIKLFERNSQGLTSDTWTLKFHALSNIKIKVPSYKEQKKIAIFLKQIDEAIEINTSKSIELGNIKQAYLQKMFI